MCTRWKSVYNVVGKQIRRVLDGGEGERNRHREINKQKDRSKTTKIQTDRSTDRYT